MKDYEFACPCCKVSLRLGCSPLECVPASDPEPAPKLEAGCEVRQGSSGIHATVQFVGGESVLATDTDGDERWWQINHLTVTKAAVPEVGDTVRVQQIGIYTVGAGLIAECKENGHYIVWPPEHQLRTPFDLAREDFTITCKGKGA